MGNESTIDTDSVDNNGTSDISSEKERGFVTGQVTSGPHCGMQRVPPDPNCGPRPYATKITALRAGTNDIVASDRSNADGQFTFALPVGDYVLHGEGGEILPRCNNVNVHITAGETITQDMYCDTGIR
jgi:hypothetical protein